LRSIALGVIGDELRQAFLEPRFRVKTPSASWPVSSRRHPCRRGSTAGIVAIERMALLGCSRSRPGAS